jgi:glycosyltransferase involved in cell wall biosynthesis
MPRRALLVLGMHRSGTSAVTRLLSLLGADLPKDPIGPVAGDNEAGFWEPAPMVDLNNELMTAAGSSWDDVLPIRRDWFESDAVEPFRIRAIELLHHQYGASEFFVFKDPRLSRLLPFWQHVLADAGVEPLYVISVRNPLEVIDSLRARDKFSVARSSLLWLRYQLEAEALTRSGARTFVPYEGLMQDWRHWASRMGDELGIRWGGRSTRSEAEIDTFLTPALWHQRRTNDEVGQDPLITAWVARAYDALRDRLAGGAEPSAVFDQIEAELAVADATYAGVVAEVERAAAALATDVDDLARDLAGAREIVSALESKTEEMGEGIEMLQSEIDKRGEALSQRDAEIREAHTRLDETEAAKAAIAEERNELSARLENRGHELVAARDEIGSLAARLEADEGDRQKLIERHMDLEKQRDAVADILSEVQAHAHKQSTEAAVRVGALEAELASLRSSTSWRITAPVRFVGDRLPFLKRPLKPIGVLLTILWWTITFRVHRKLPEYLRWRRAQKQGARVVPAPVAETAVVEPETLPTIADEIARFTQAGPDYQDPDPSIALGQPAGARVVAFYLPQFHATPENDEFWGAGFTEWRNLARGAPRFVGHYQPRIPRDLGFYDLTDPDVMREQVRLAKAAGLGGFCFYYYMFDHGRLLDRPIDLFLENPDIDFPFSLVWANENWTRTWDGHDRDVLMPQTYREGWQRHLASDLARHFADERYIRVGGRPLFTIYRPGIIPGGREELEVLREELTAVAGVEPWMLMVQGFGDIDPGVFGLDGAVEFPPHKLGEGLTETRDARVLLDAAFAGNVWSYDELVERAGAEPVPPFPLIRTVVPSWDNDARRPGRGLVIADGTPAKYENWLRQAIGFSGQNPFHGESIVFVNAWNEWAEGTYLEPDVFYGSAYLNATARAVTDYAPAAKQRVLLVGHDAHRHGAQMLLLNIGRTFANRFGVPVTFLLLGGGDLLDDYRRVGEVTVISAQSPELEATVTQLVAEGLELALTNTTPAGAVVPLLKKHDVRVVSLVHEMPALIGERGWEGRVGLIAGGADVVIFASELVRDGFTRFVDLPVEKTVIRPQGLYQRLKFSASDREDVRDELNLDQDARIVLGVGYGDLRKGFDTFVNAARDGAAKKAGLEFVWVGAVDGELSQWLLSAPPDNVHHVPFTDHVGRYYAAADVLFLSSREDPYPATVQEAFAAGIPVVGFAGCSGTGEVIDRFGALAEQGDAAHAVEAIVAVLDADSPERAQERRRYSAQAYEFGDYAFELLTQLKPDVRRVSVVVPNFNYSHHLAARLGSIFNQSYPVYEVIVLDDASTDDSLQEMQRIAEETGREFAVHTNAENAGSIMRQWWRGIDEAAGDLVWIAEADDSSRPGFLAEMAQALHPGVGFAFCDSVQIDGDGHHLADSYRYYYDTVDAERFAGSFRMAGTSFLREYLSVKNLILNVSSVVFDRQRVHDVFASHLDDLEEFTFAGDWGVYARMCLNGQVAFVSRPLNIHRRHDASATVEAGRDRHLEEVAAIHQFVGAHVTLDPGVEAAQRRYLAILHDQLS